MISSRDQCPPRARTPSTIACPPAAAHEPHPTWQGKPRRLAASSFVGVLDTVLQPTGWEVVLGAIPTTAFPTPPICYNSIPPKKGRRAENLKPICANLQQICSKFAVSALGTLRVQRNSAAVECASAPTRPAPDGRGRGFAGAARGRRLPRSVPWPRPSHSDYFARGTLKAPAADRRHSAVGSWSPDLRQVAHQSVIWVLPRPLRSGC